MSRGGLSRPTAASSREDQRPIGAAWFRFLPADAPGYGFVDAETPEVSIGVVLPRRGQGIGALLLNALATRAREAGPATLGLSVESDNYARGLYERVGFQTPATRSPCSCVFEVRLTELDHLPRTCAPARGPLLAYAVRVGWLSKSLNAIRRSACLKVLQGCGDHGARVSAQGFPKVVRAW